MGFDIIRGDFRKDLALLLAVTIVLGSVLAGMGARLSYGYFNRAIAGLIGEYGEYDVIMHVRPEFAKAAEASLREVLTAGYPGSSVKRGVTVAGSANFLLAFPGRLFNRTTFSGLPRALANIPGYNGSTLVAEPRVTVRGVPTSLVPLLSGEIGAIRGVRFLFEANGAIEVMLASERDRDRVTGSVGSLLARYRIIDARLPLGVRIPDRERVGNALVEGIQRNFGVTARDLGFGNEERAQGLVRTLSELRSFLLGYSSSITLALTPERRLVRGDYLVLSATGLVPGTPVSGLPIAQVYLVEGGTATAILVRGGLGDVMGGRTSAVVQGNLLKGNNPEAPQGQLEAGNRVGPVTVSRRREELLLAVRETQKALAEFDRTVAVARTTLRDLSSTLSGYRGNLEAISGLRQALGEYENKLAGAAAGYSRLNATGLRELISRQSALAARIMNNQRDIGTLPGTLAGVRDSLANQRPVLQATIAALPAKAPLRAQLSGYSARLAESLAALQAGVNRTTALVGANKPLVAELSALERTTPGVLLDLANVGNELQRITDTRNALRKVMESVDTVIRTLKGIDILALDRDVAESLATVDALDRVDASVILRQVRYFERTLPEISDIDIGRSLTLLDTYLSGQAVPGERVLLFAPATVPDSYVAQVVREMTGEERVTVLSTPVGEVQTDLRANVLTVLGQVRALIAAFLTLLTTSLVLVTDHATIINAQRVVNAYRGYGGVGRRGRSKAGGLVYGVFVGCLISILVGRISGAGLFTLPPLAIGLIGALLGLWAALYSERLSPVDGNEVMAGEAMGFTMDEVMRQIVVPSGRLGLMTLLNKRFVRV